MTQPRRRRFGVRMAEIARQTGVPHDSVLRDHALSYVLAGIADTAPLIRYAVFKGGTSLRKCYFAGYRYSEDLDFSTRDLHAWTSREISELLADACEAAQARAEEIEAPYTFEARKERHREDRPSQHDFGYFCPWSPVCNRTGPVGTMWCTTMRSSWTTIRSTTSRRIRC